MSATSRWRIGLLAAAGGVAAVAGIIVLFVYRASPAPSAPKESFPIPPYRPTAFLNTGPDAKYVGSAVCAECHRANHQSYLHTEHSRALSVVDPAAEPPDSFFEHAASGRRYRIYRANGQLRHEETIRHGDEVIARVDLPLRYLVGSGHFSRTYVVEIDSFLYESPVTWYASRGKWDMSPGYDQARHMGFERPIAESCLYCHAGRVEPVEGAAHRLHVLEQAIGCESCHGPGSVHRDRRKEQALAAGAEDLTIVNPARLPRTLQEDICSACHLSGAAAVLLRGRSIADFRPGTPLSDYRIHYRVDGGGDEMMVVGHVEQMRQSKCWQQSEMTCLTCHDPHAREKAKDPAATYRAICMNCHEKKPCTLAPANRLQKDGTDNCSACHMPRGDTDIPHIAFTHHRIGHHGSKKTASPTQAATLAPIESVEHLAPADRQRNLGIAYLEAAGNAAYAQKHGAAFRQTGRKLLADLYAAGMRDPESMRHLLEGEDSPRQYALEILQDQSAPANARAGALMSLARIDMESGDLAAAAGRLAEHNRIFATSEGFYRQGMCNLQQNDPAAALGPLQRSLAIRPDRAATQGALSEAYQLLGRGPQSEEHARKQRLLRLRGEP